MKLLTFFISLLIFKPSPAQVKQYQNLLDSALNGHGAIFVYSEPIKNIRLDQNDMRDYFESYRSYKDKDLDTVMFEQIIQNSKRGDSSLWLDAELPGFLLVHSRDEWVSKKYAVQKLALTDKVRIKFYINQINQFNATEIFDKNIYYFSRPVFDNSKTFAIVEWDNGHSGLGGGGGIVLYHLQENTWKEVGIINNWKH